MSVVGDFEHDARVARTDTTVGQFAGTSGSIIGNRWVNTGFIRAFLSLMNDQYSKN